MCNAHQLPPAPKTIMVKDASSLVARTMVKNKFSDINHFLKRYSKPNEYRYELSFGSMFSGLESPGVSLEALLPNGFDHVFAIDKNKHCQAILKEHFNIGRVLGDVKDVKIKDLPYCDLFWFSPSCVNFSKAGNGDGEDGKEGDLWKSGMAFVSAKKPKAFVCEQVENIRVSHEKVWQRMVNAAKKAAKSRYHVWEFDMKCQDFGLPQNRHRCFLVGIAKECLEGAPIPLLPPPKLDMVPLKSLLDMDDLEAEIPENNVHLPNLVSSFQHIIRNGKDPVKSLHILDLGGTKSNQRFEECPCLTASRCGSFAYFISCLMRYMRVEEMMMIQGLPSKRYTIPKSVSNRQFARMVGNSVPTTMAMAIFQQILPNIVEKGTVVKEMVAGVR